ncbi:MAG: hypothetical protein NVSMB20_17390 [Bradyrhizobium sp.]
MPVTPAATVSLAAFLRLAGACAPDVDPTTLTAFALAESGFAPDARHTNPATERRAASLDVGLMQINSITAQRLGYTSEQVAEPCTNLRAAARVMVEGYSHCLAGRDPQAALRCMASRYNTGSDTAGVANGYQAKVWRAAERLVPAIQLAQRGADPIQSVPQAKPRPHGVLFRHEARADEPNPSTLFTHHGD